MATPIDLTDAKEWLDRVQLEAHEVVSIVIHAQRERLEVRCRTEQGRKYKRRFSLRWKVAESYKQE